MSQYQGGGRPAAPGQRPLTAHPGGQISWQQTALALGSLMIGAITSATVNSRGNPWPAIIIWIAIVVININIFRIGRRVRRSPD